MVCKMVTVQHLCIQVDKLHERMNSPLQRRSLPTQAKALAHVGGLRRLAEGGAAKPTKVARGFNHCMGANLTLAYYSALT